MSDQLNCDVRDPDAAFTAEEMAFTETWPTLGPAYERARGIAERVMTGFEAEHFKPLIDKLADEFAQRLWNDVEASMLSDVESNVQGSIWRAVDATVNALLTGERWAVERYALREGRYSEAAKVRAAIFDQCRDQITDQRVADLEAEVAMLSRHLESARRC